VKTSAQLTATLSLSPSPKSKARCNLPTGSSVNLPFLRMLTGELATPSADRKVPRENELGRSTAIRRYFAFGTSAATWTARQSEATTPNPAPGMIMMPRLRAASSWRKAF
jgi:hypothetical protein